MWRRLIELTATILSLPFNTNTARGSCIPPSNWKQKSPDLNLKVISTVPIHLKSTFIHNRIMEWLSLKGPWEVFSVFSAPPHSTKQSQHQIQTRLLRGLCSQVLSISNLWPLSCAAAVQLTEEPGFIFLGTPQKYEKAATRLTLSFLISRLNKPCSPSCSSQVLWANPTTTLVALR